MLTEVCGNLVLSEENNNVKTMVVISSLFNIYATID